MLMGVMPGLPKMWFPIVDVRDVAQAHLNAIKVPEAANKRFLYVATLIPSKNFVKRLLKSTVTSILLTPERWKNARRRMFVLRTLGDTTGSLITLDQPAS